jgi:hypothetical protein
VGKIWLKEKMCPQGKDRAREKMWAGAECGFRDNSLGGDGTKEKDLEGWAIKNCLWGN